MAQRMRSDPSKRSQEFWLDYHNDHGHRTIYCRQFQFEVAHLLTKGYLRKLLSDKGRQASTTGTMRNLLECHHPNAELILSSENQKSVESHIHQRKRLRYSLHMKNEARKAFNRDISTFHDGDTDGLMFLGHMHW